MNCALFFSRQGKIERGWCINHPNPLRATGKLSHAHPHTSPMTSTPKAILVTGAARRVGAICHRPCAAGQM